MTISTDNTVSKTIGIMAQQPRLAHHIGPASDAGNHCARIELACARLSWTEQAIGQIALDCGYGDQAAFTRQFRKSVGLTPRAYRERHRSGPSAGQ